MGSFLSDSPAVEELTRAETGLSDDLPKLFEEFSRVTTELAASHDVLLAEVEALRDELAAKNRRLEHKKRLEALGRVAAGVAHEFRNPLGGIRLSCEAVLKRCHPEDASRARLKHVLTAVDHLNRIVSELLTFTRDEPVRRESTRVESLVEEATRVAFGSEPKVDVHVEGPKELEAEIDRHALVQVLVNLLLNADQAREESGRIGIWWGSRDSEVWIEVADDGPGIPAGEEERIFLPFHTLREDGTGLGLAICQTRVHAHDGEIAVVTDAWGGGPDYHGARFRITLPREER